MNGYKAATCRHRGHCEWVSCEHCKHYMTEIDINPEQAIKVLSTEMNCVATDDCDHNCGKCKYAMEQKEILDAEAYAIKAIKTQQRLESLKSEYNAYHFDNDYWNGIKHAIDLMEKIID